MVNLWIALVLLFAPVSDGQGVGRGLPITPEPVPRIGGSGEIYLPWVLVEE